MKLVRRRIAHTFSQLSERYGIVNQCHVAPAFWSKTKETSIALGQKVPIEEVRPVQPVAVEKCLRVFVQAHARDVLGLPAQSLKVLHETHVLPCLVRPMCAVTFVNSIAIVTSHLRFPCRQQSLLRVADQSKAVRVLHNHLLLDVVGDHLESLLPRFAVQVLHIWRPACVWPLLPEVLLVNVLVHRGTSTLSTSTDDGVCLWHKMHEDVVLLSFWQVSFFQGRSC